MQSLKQLRVMEQYNCGSYNGFVTEVLTHYPSLVALTLDFWYMRIQDMHSLATAQHHCRSLKTLMLTHLEIDDAIVQCFVDNWHPDSNLRYLFLPWKKLGLSGCSCTVSSSTASCIKKIELHDNNIGFEGLRLIGNFLPSLQHVTHLQIENCVHLHHFHDFTCEAAHQQEQARHRAGQALLNGIKDNVYMKEFSFDEDVFPDMCVGSVWYRSLRMPATGNHVFARRNILRPMMMVYNRDDKIPTPIRFPQSKDG